MNLPFQDRAEAILEFWFGSRRGPHDFPTEKAKMWFQSSPKTNGFIEKHFKKDFERARAGELECWKEDPRLCLALIVLLDQFSRNLYGLSADAFAQDGQALGLAEYALGKGYDKTLHPAELCFLYMPYEHSEDIVMQKKSVSLFSELAERVPASIEFPIRNALDYAEQHFKIIQRFGRFPHRNEALKRKLTLEETLFLREAGSSF